MKMRLITILVGMLIAPPAFAVPVLQQKTPMSIRPTEIVCKATSGRLDHCTSWCNAYDKRTGQKPGTCASINCTSCK